MKLPSINLLLLTTLLYGNEVSYSVAGFATLPMNKKKPNMLLTSGSAGGSFQASHEAVVPSSSSTILSIATFAGDTPFGNSTIGPAGLKEALNKNDVLEKKSSHLISTPASSSSAGRFSAFVRNTIGNISLDWYGVRASRPSDHANKEKETIGKAGAFNWYDPTKAASSLIKLRTNTPAWQLSKAAAYAARVGTKLRGDEIGANWDDEIKRWDAVLDELDVCYKEVLQTSTEYPAYYLEPFHAYDSGNLSWLAAKEYEAASLTVFSDLYTDKPELSGCPQFRDSFTQATKAMYLAMLGRPLRPKSIVDIGCGVGLSTRRYALDFPEANVLGIDLSPHFLAVAQYRQKERPLSNMQFLHAQGENTGLPADSTDVVSLTTVVHELPRSAAKAVFLEAKRILKSDGILTFMDMDPTDEFMSYMNGYGGLFKAGITATEPHLIEYISIDFPALLEECGFVSVQRKRVTNRHCVYTATLEKGVQNHISNARTPDYNSDSFTLGSSYRSVFDYMCPIRERVLEKGSSLSHYKAGDVIIEQGSVDTTSVYKIVSGTCQVDSPQGTKLFGKGEFVGESSWLSAGKAHAHPHVVALSPAVTMMKLDTSIVEQVLSETEITRAKIKMSLDHSAELDLKALRPAVTQPCRADHLEHWMRVAKVEQHAAGTRILQAGRAAHTTYIVKNGECKNVMDGRRVLSYSRGDYFGKQCPMAAPKHGRAVEVVAETDVELWVLTDEEFDQIKEEVYMIGEDGPWRWH